MNEKEQAERVPVYRIRVKGIISRGWSEWFSGLELIPQAEGETLIVGALPDQAALHGILGQIRDLNLPLLSVSVDQDTDRS